MKNNFLKNIEKEIEEIVTQYRKNPSKELYEKWIDLLKEYTKKHTELKHV